MFTILSSYLFVLGLTMFKFILGPLTSISLGLHFVEAFFLTILGMMFSVLLVNFLGAELRTRLLNRYGSKRKFSARSRQVVRVWRRFGLAGVAGLTPLIFTPIGGTLIAVAFGEKRWKIVLYMGVSACFWSLIFNGLLYFVGMEAAKAWIIR